MSGSTLIYRADLQGVRALAIALVVLSHAGMPGLEGGYVGVDVFFVLSGYLITGLLLREHQANGRIRLLGFLARRLRRLLPALLVMLLATTLLGGALLSPHELGVQTASVGYAASWTSNLYFAFTDFDYFDESFRRDLYLHTWSLGVEEQFYLVWSLGCALVLGGIGSRRGLVGPRHHWLVFVVLAGLSFGLSLYWSAHQSLWAFYLMPSRLWQFALGALVYVLRDAAGPNAARGLAGSLTALPGKGLVGAGMIVGSALYLDAGVVYPGAWALLPSLGAALLILGGEPDARDLGARWLATSPLVWLGDRSYSLYLWHWPLLMLGFAWGFEQNALALAAIVLLALLLASASYRWVELPIWKGRFSAAASVPTVAWGLSGIAIVVATLVPLNQWLRDEHHPAAVFVRMARDDVPAFYRIRGCDTWYRDAAVKPCVFGAADGRRTAVLFGDSVGVQWFGVMPAIFPEPDWRIVVFTKSACPMVDEDFHYEQAGGVFEVCRDWRNGVLEELARLRPEVVLLGSATDYDFTPEQWIAGSRRIVERLAAHTDQVAVIAGTPELSFHGPQCLGRWIAAHGSDVAPDPAICREAAVHAQATRVSGYLAEAVAPLANAWALDFADIVCPDGYCSALTERGVVVYRDQLHLTDTFVRAQADVVRARLLQTGVGGVIGEPALQPSMRGDNPSEAGSSRAERAPM